MRPFWIELVFSGNANDYSETSFHRVTGKTGRRKFPVEACGICDNVLQEHFTCGNLPRLTISNGCRVDKVPAATPGNL